MSTENVSDFVIGLVEREMEDESRVVTLDSRLRDDLEVDSLSMAVIAVDMEDRFGIRLDLADLIRIETVRDVVSIVEARRAGRSEHVSATDDAG